MSELKPCPFCGGKNIYETYTQEYGLGIKNPIIFCNSCKIIFAVEDDSPYLNCEEDYAYRKKRTKDAWNRRADMRSDRMNEAISKASVCEILADIYPTDGEKVIAVKEVNKAYEAIQQLPSIQIQPEQTKMIKEIRKWINSGNRGNADYFIVDKIEEIINKYE